MSPHDKIFWTRFAFGIAAAALCIAFGATGMRGITFGLVMYVASCYAIRYGLRISPAEVGGGAMLTTGLMAFLGSWILLWTVSYTFRISAIVSASIGFPKSLPKLQSSRGRTHRVPRAASEA